MLCLGIESDLKKSILFFGIIKPLNIFIVKSLICEKSFDTDILLLNKSVY